MQRRPTVVMLVGEHPEIFDGEDGCLASGVLRYGGGCHESPFSHEVACGDQSNARGVGVAGWGEFSPARRWCCGVGRCVLADHSAQGPKPVFADDEDIQSPGGRQSLPEVGRSVLWSHRHVNLNFGTVAEKEGVNETGVVVSRCVVPAEAGEYDIQGKRWDMYVVSRPSAEDLQKLVDLTGKDRCKRFIRNQPGQPSAGCESPRPCEA